MTNWQPATLSDALDLQRGHDLPSNQRNHGRVPVIGSFGVTGHHDVALYPGPGVAIGRSGASIGMATFVRDAYWPLNTCLFVSDFKGNLPYWIFLLLKMINFQQFNSGSAQPSLNRNFLRKIPILLPPRLEQQAITEVLVALDDKIDANTALAHTAEDLAIVRTSLLNDHVRLGEIVELQRRTISPAGLGESLVEHYSLPSFDAGRLPVVESPTQIRSGKFDLTVPCVLVSKLNPRFPRVWPILNRGSLRGLASTEFMPLVGQFVSPGVLWALLSQPTFGKGLESQVAGTSGSHQRVRPEDMLNSEVHDPRGLSPNEIEGIESLVSLSVHLGYESQSLAEVRDTLLPQLMSGRLRVKDAERQVESVV